MYYFVAYCLVSLVLTQLTNSVLMTEDLYFEAFGEYLSSDVISELISGQSDFVWYSIILLPLYYAAKFSLVAGCISIGAQIAGLEVSFGKVFVLAVQAEFIFFFLPLAKILWFGLYDVEYTLRELQFFPPLSLINLFDPQQVRSWYVYPLQSINLLEVFYCCLMALGLQSVSGASFTRMFQLVGMTYGFGFLLWMTLVVFVSVSLL